MPRSKTAWKKAEAKAAEKLKGRRVLRGANFAVSDVDVIVDDFPHLKIDSKYRTRHAHHSLMAEIVAKYCKHPEDIPVLVTKHHNQVGEYATVPLEFLGLLLDAVRTLHAYKKDVEQVGAGD